MAYLILVDDSDDISPLDQRSRVATSSSAKGRLLSPAPSVPQIMDTTMPLDDPSLGRSSGATPPTLTEITFRPHSTHCYSFSATVQDGCEGQGLSLGQVVRLIASIGHVGKIDDFTIKPVEQHSYLLSGFSWHTSSFPSLGRTTPSTTTEAGRDYVDVMCTRPQDGRAVDTRGFSSWRSELSSSDDDEGGSSDSDTDLGDEYSSEDEPGHSGTRTNVPWDRLDELRLLAYKKENRPWDWILTKFPGRTETAVRQRVSIARNRGK
ncbi:hypothetical protein DL98DRAFT_123601 [Cadophora sp. DSE1049]|nr:hypothetical protein DL98DRAFT_123601 [Cadophora sp. DSE1049]